MFTNACLSRPLRGIGAVAPEAKSRVGERAREGLINHLVSALARSSSIRYNTFGMRVPRCCDIYDFEFSSKALNAWVLSQQMSHATDRVVERELNEAGLSSAELWVLFVLKHHPGPPTPAEIARWLFRETHSVAGLLNRMEQKGLVKRQKDAQNRRLTRVLLTPKGEELYHRANETRIVARLMSCFSDSELQEFGRYLRTLRDVALKDMGVKVRPLKVPSPAPDMPSAWQAEEAPVLKRK